LTSDTRGWRDGAMSEGPLERWSDVTAWFAELRCSVTDDHPILSDIDDRGRAESQAGPSGRPPTRLVTQPASPTRGWRGTPPARPSRTPTPRHRPPTPERSSRAGGTTAADQPTTAGF